MDWQPIESAPRDTFVRLKFADGSESWGDLDTSYADATRGFPLGMWCLENQSVALGINDAQPVAWAPYPSSPQ